MTTLIVRFKPDAESPNWPSWYEWCFEGEEWAEDESYSDVTYTIPDEDTPAWLEELLDTDPGVISYTVEKGRQEMEGQLRVGWDDHIGHFLKCPVCGKPLKATVEAYFLDCTPTLDFAKCGRYMDGDVGIDHTDNSTSEFVLTHLFCPNGDWDWTKASGDPEPTVKFAPEYYAETEEELSAIERWR